MSAATARLDEIDARAADGLSTRIERRMGDVRLRVEDVPALTAALRAVLALHHIRDAADDRCCDGCEAVTGFDACVPYPCPTVHAIATHLDPTRTDVTP